MLYALSHHPYSSSCTYKFTLAPISLVNISSIFSFTRTLLLSLTHNSTHYHGYVKMQFVIDKWLPKCQRKKQLKSRSHQMKNPAKLNKHASGHLMDKWTPHGQTTIVFLKLVVLLNSKHIYI